MEREDKNNGIDTSCKLAQTEKIKDKGKIITALTILSDDKCLQEKEALIFIKIIEKTTRMESNIYRKEFFSQHNLYMQLIRIADKYNEYDSIIEQILWALGEISKRYKVSDNSIFNFFVKYINSSNRKIKLAVAAGIIFMPQFDNYKGRWDFILNMPTIPPKSKSMRLFRIAVDNRISEITNDFKEKIIYMINDFITNEKLDIDTFNLYNSTINKLA